MTLSGCFRQSNGGSSHLPSLQEQQWTECNPHDRYKVHPLSICQQEASICNNSVKLAEWPLVLSPEACNWPWPDRMQRNASRAKIVRAGRMTATARADVGARFEARP